MDREYGEGEDIRSRMHDERERYTKRNPPKGQFSTSASAYAYERAMARKANRSSEGTRHTRKPGQKGG